MTIENMEERIEEAVGQLVETFSDGFQLSDLPTLIRVATEAAEMLNAPGSEKRVFAIRVIESVIRKTDTPWLPDSLTDPLMIRFVPGLIDLVVDAAKGRIAVNGKVSEETKKVFDLDDEEEDNEKNNEEPGD